MSVGEDFPQVEEFKCLRVLFMRKEQENDRLVVMWEISLSVVIKRELTQSKAFHLQVSLTIISGHGKW